jgi:hypothetical protein
VKNWEVQLTTRVTKDTKILPEKIIKLLVALIKEIEVEGPMQPEWPHFSKLGKTTYHCHLKQGRPTYVACWEVIDKQIKLIEVYYAGTHEKAPY